jgi:hypothetical protein
MLSYRTIKRLYTVSILLSSLSLLLSTKLLGTSYGAHGAEPLILALSLIYLLVFFGIINLVFFIPLNTRVFKWLSIKGSIILFLIPSVGFLGFFLIKSGFKLDEDIIILSISLTVNIICMCWLLFNIQAS